MGKRSATTARSQVRQRILRVLAGRAVHKAGLARRLGVGWSTVQHHARALVREGHVREVGYQGLRVLVPATVPQDRLKRAVVLAVPEHLEALRTVVKGRDHRIQDLADRLNWSRKTARRCLYALLGAGLVNKSKDYHPRFVSTQAGRLELRRAG